MVTGKIIGVKGTVPSSSHYFFRKAKIGAEAELPKISSSPSSQALPRWRLFTHEALKDQTLHPSRLTAIIEITGSLIAAKTIDELGNEAKDGFGDVFPYADTRIELREDLLNDSLEVPSPRSFPGLFESGMLALVSQISREAKSVEDVNQKMMGLPLFDDNQNLLGAVVLSLVQEIAVFPKGLENYAAPLRSHASGLLNNLVIHTKKAFVDIFGLWNKIYFDVRLPEEFERHLRYSSSLSLLSFDVDHFKQCNDTHGHPFGDRVLREISGVVKREVRITDIPARIGGEEFSIILPNTNIADARRTAERIRRAIEKHEFIKDDQSRVPITISAGVIEATDDIKTPQQLVKATDTTMYKAKAAGRNKVM